MGAKFALGSEGKENNPMRFLVQIETYETLVGRDTDRLIRDTVGQRLSQVMETGKIKEFGFLTDRRGAFSSWTSTRPRNSTTSSVSKFTVTSAFRHRP
jgi:hypothetical protein